MNQKNLSLWIKIILVGMGIIGAVVYFWLVPWGFRSSLPWKIFLWVSGLPSYAVLFFGWGIASRIGKDRSFSVENARALRNISWLAAADSAWFFVGHLVLAVMGESRWGNVLLSLIIVFIGVAISVAAAVLSHLVLKAAALQEQSDLTI
jgi:hypothetical protein